MAHTKSGGSTRLGRDSKPKYLGVKLYNGQAAKIGSIIVRQRGTKFLAGKNVALGKDDSIYALKEGMVQFKNKRRYSFNGDRKIKKIVHVL